MVAIHEGRVIVAIGGVFVGAGRSDDGLGVLLLSPRGKNEDRERKQRSKLQQLPNIRCLHHCAWMLQRSFWVATRARGDKTSDAESVRSGWRAWLSCPGERSVWRAVDRASRG